MSEEEIKDPLWNDVQVTGSVLESPQEAIDWLYEQLRHMGDHTLNSVYKDIARVTKALFVDGHYIDHFNGLTAETSRLQGELKARRLELQGLRQQLDQIEKCLAKEIEDHNLTRDTLHDSENLSHRLNGYIDGLEESRPLRMVPEERSSRRDEQSLSSMSYSAEDAYSHQRQTFGGGRRRWYHR